jgi:hypothetical protein
MYIKTNIHFLSHVTHLYLRWEKFQTEVIEKIKTHILFISLSNQLDAQNLFHNKFYFMPLHVSSTCALIMRRSKFHYTASGIITLICGRLELSHYLINLMHKICFTGSFISCLYMFRSHVLIISGSKLYYTASGIISCTRRPPIGVMIPEAV